MVCSGLTLNVAHDRMANMTPKRVLNANMAQTHGFQVSGWAPMTLSCDTVRTVRISVGETLARVHLPVSLR